jgi:hypothetical protein
MPCAVHASPPETVTRAQHEQVPAADAERCHIRCSGGAKRLELRISKCAGNLQTQAWVCLQQLVHWCKLLQQSALDSKQQEQVSQVARQATCACLDLLLIPVESYMRPNGSVVPHAQVARRHSGFCLILLLLSICEVRCPLTVLLHHMRTCILPLSLQSVDTWPPAFWMRARSPTTHVHQCCFCAKHQQAELAHTCMHAALLSCTCGT